MQESQSGTGGTYHIGGVTWKIGGFIESATIYRTGNETADVGSNYGSGIPFSANPNAHISELRENRRGRAGCRCWRPDDPIP